MSKQINNSQYIIAPGATILELLEANSMTQIDLAFKTGINKKTINQIIKGKAPITPATALKLEYVFNIPASFWNNLESLYQEALEREKDIISIKNDLSLLKMIPYNEMAKRKWEGIEATRDDLRKVINLRKFFSVASLSFDSELKRKIAYRKVDNEKFSFESLYCWLRYGEIQSNKEIYPKFNNFLLKEKLLEIRKLAHLPFLDNITKIKEILRNCGISLVYEPHLPHTYVYGISYKVTSDKAIIMISDRGKRDDILWFTLFHEIGHLIYHSKKEIFIDRDDEEKDNIEIQADNFAKNILINPKNYQNFIKDYHNYNEKILKKFAQDNDISVGILIGRLQKDGLIGWNEYNHLITRI